MDVQRTYLLIDVSSGAQKITGSGFMDVQRTCLLIDVSSGAQKITDSDFGFVASQTNPQRLARAALEIKQANITTCKS
jgi:hypothetical protein